MQVLLLVTRGRIKRGGGGGLNYLNFIKKYKVNVVGEFWPPPPSKKKKKFLVKKNMGLWVEKINKNCVIKIK